MGGRQIEQSKLTTFSLLVIAATCLAVALYWTRPVMVLFMLALFLTHLVAPLADGLQIGLKAPAGCSPRRIPCHREFIEPADTVADHLGRRSHGERRHFQK